MATHQDPYRRNPVMKDTPKSATANEGFSAEEKAAMKAHAKEMKAAAEKADGLAMALASIAEMPEPDRSMAERVHAIVVASAPSLSPRTWYGMPAYAKDGKVICFFQAASKFMVRYATFGFQPDAMVDDGTMWPIAYALTELTADAEAWIDALVKKAVG
jgi:uncharacterized protein YdhG (YjbR/CyaY superfamily)